MYKAISPKYDCLSLATINTTNERVMNGWEFLSSFWWLIFPVGGMLMAILGLICKNYSLEGDLIE